MLPSWRLARTNLSVRRTRTVLMIVAVALVSSLVVAVACSIQSAQSSFEVMIQRAIGAIDARIFHRFRGHVDESFLERAQEWDGVASAAGRLADQVTLNYTDESGASRRLDVRGRGSDLRIESQFREIVLSDGRMPEAPQEILIGPIIRDNSGLGPGDTVRAHLRLANETTGSSPAKRLYQQFGRPFGDQLNQLAGLLGAFRPRADTPTIELTIVGVYERLKLGPLQQPRIHIDLETLQQITRREDQLTSVAIIVENGVDVEAFCELHAHEMPSSLSLEPIELARTAYDRRVRATRVGFIVGSVLSFMSAAFIIVTGLTTAVSEQQREMAVTRCIGAARKQLFGAQLFVGAIIGGAGAVFGIPLGIGLAALIVKLNPDFLPAGLFIAPLGIVLGVIGAVGSGVAGALYPAWLASRVSPLRAMTARGRPPSRRGVLICGSIALAWIGVQLSLMIISDWDTRFWAYVFVGLPVLLIGYFMLAVPLLLLLARATAKPLSMLLRLPAGMLGRSIAATPYRHGFTAGALMVGIAIMVSTWSGAKSLLNDWVGRIKFTDSVVMRASGISPSERRAIEDLPFITATSPVGYFSTAMENRQFGIEEFSAKNTIVIGFDPDSFFELNSVNWLRGDPERAIERLREGDAIIVAEQFLHGRQELGVGDTLSLAQGEGVFRDFEIVGVVSATGLNLIVQAFGIQHAHGEHATSCVFMDLDRASEHFHNDDIHFLQVNLSDDISDADAERAVTAAAPGVTFASGRFVLDMIDELINGALTVYGTVAMVSLIIASFGVGNVIIANVQARRFEYGVLRSVGGHRGLLMRLVLGEAILLGMGGALTGTLLGMHLAWITATQYRDLGGIVYTVHFPTATVVAGWLIVIGLASLAAAPAAISVMLRTPSRLLSLGRSA